MEGVYGVQWLRHPKDLMMYINARLEEPCGRSVPGSLFKALVFMENAAELPQERRLSTSMALHHYLLGLGQGRKHLASRWRFCGHGKKES